MRAGSPSAVVLRRPIDARGLIQTLHAVHAVRIVQGASSGRATRRVVDDNTALGRARLALNDSARRRLGRARSGLDVLDSRATRADGIGAVVADFRGAHSRRTETETLCQSGEQAADSEGVARELDPHGFAALAVDDGIVFAVLAVEVFGDVVGVLAAALAEIAALTVSLEGMGTVGAVLGVGLKGVHHVVLVVAEVAHDDDEIGGFDGRRHGV